MGYNKKIKKIYISLVKLKIDPLIVSMIKKMEGKGNRKGKLTKIKEEKNKIIKQNNGQ
jgi:hypothetical protein